MMFLYLTIDGTETQTSSDMNWRETAICGGRLWDQWAMAFWNCRRAGQGSFSDPYLI